MRDEKGRFIKGHKQSSFLLNKKRNDISNEKHPFWKGARVGYRGLHAWIQRKLGKATKCMRDLTHQTTRYHWANISGLYKRDFSDWIQLCPSCNAKDRRVRK